MKLRHIIVIAAAAASLLASAQTTRRLSASKANEYGLVYTLPTTQVKVTLEAEITLQQPGEFYKYAKKYLNVSNPITAESRSARLKSVVVTTAGIPNTEERYAVTFKAGTAPFMLLSPNDIPLALNTEQIYEPKAVELPVAQKAAPTPLETSAARQVVSEEMARSQSTAKRAELAAQALFAIRQTRSELITGQADQMPPDGKSLQLMLDNLEAQEQALMAMFVGTTATYTDVQTFTITPDDDINRRIIARISPIDGIVDSSDLSGAPVYLSLEVVSEGELPLSEKGTPLPFPKNGVAYCIPGVARLTVAYDGKTFADNNLELAQFGVVYGLAPTMFTDRKAPAYIIFNPATGAIAKQGTAE